YRIAIGVGLSGHRKVFDIARLHGGTVLTFERGYAVFQRVATPVLHEIVCRVHAIILIAVERTDWATYASIKVHSRLITGDHVIIAGASEELPHFRAIERHIEGRSPLEIFLTDVLRIQGKLDPSIPQRSNILVLFTITC